MYAETVPIVIDNGSDTCKAGFGGEEKPRSIFSYKRVKMSQNDLYLDNIGQIRTLPNWREIKEVLGQAIYKELNVHPENHPVLLADERINPKMNREKTVQIMFEFFCTPALYIVNPAVLSLFACGCVTGVVLDSGNYYSHAVPIFEGFELPHCAQRLGIAGHHLTNFLLRILNTQGYCTPIEKEIIRDIKEHSCYVALEFKNEMFKAATSNIAQLRYTLPDGNVIYLNNERFCCPEALFQPNLINLEANGIHEILHKSISKCNVNYRKHLYANIVLSGGTTTFPGFEYRIDKEIRDLARLNTTINVIAPPRRKTSAWRGGSILASLSSFKDKWISRKEYDEYGPTIVCRKRF